MFSLSRYRSIHYSKFKAAARLLTRPIPAVFRDTYMGPYLPNHTLAEPGDFSHPHDSPPGQKCGIRGRRVDRALFSRNAVSKALTQTSGLGEDNGNHTHDTSRSSDNIKSFNSPDGTRNVGHRW